ncbi:MAG: toll/interleukin-1 receptor domain-containing protein [Clostridia bacterium]|nr:toll/interleukin-1 receptor domain-containing protein [Clostridia bacterium]
MIIKCKMCGGDLEFQPGVTYGTCEFCGSTSTIPQAEDENKLNRYNRANHFRRQCEFDKAVTAYEKLLEQDDTDAEAHWGAVISRYGIEYVEDPATGKRIPTCHRVQVASILADADYLAAVEYAPDAASRDLYKQQAAEIAEIQKGILAISNNEKPYDVFICYKETDENGQRTHDSQWAQDVYYGLTEQGYKVFFSRITLEDKLGQQYEPYIFAALNSAKVMVVIGSKPEYFNAVWVKNEWSRYLALMAKDRKRLLIPCYRGMDPYDLPEELSSLQSQDMSKIGFMQDLLRGVKKVLDADKKPEQPKVIQQAAQSASASAGNTAPLLRRAFMFLEDGDWRSADEYCEKVLDLEPENGRAYLGKLMAELKVRNENSLDQLPEPFDRMNNYNKAIRYGDAGLQQKLKADIRTINERNEHKRQSGIFADAKKQLDNASTVSDCVSARKSFESIPAFDGVSAMLKKCDEKAETIRNSLYTNAVNAMKAAGDSSNKWDEARKRLAEHELNNYRDVDELRTQAAKRYDECLAAEKEAQRRKDEKARREAEAAAARKKRNTVLGILAAIIAIAVFVVVTNVIIPGNKYKAAEQLRNDGKYAEAVAVFTELGTYKDAAIQIGATYYAEGEAKREAQDWAGAVTAFTNAGSYSDAVTQIGVTYYAEGEAKREAQEWAGAVTAFTNAGSYSDAVTQIGATYYAEGEAKRTAQEWAGAVTAFTNAGSYSDAVTQIGATYYAEGEAKRTAQEWAGAVTAFTNAGSYSDAVTQITETYYQRAQALKEKCDYAGAAAIFTTIKGYKDVDKLLTNDENIAAAAAAARDPFTKVGNIVTYGHYEQDNNTGNGKEAIEWIVLKYDSTTGRSLLLSQYGLDEHRFDASEYQGWDKSEIRGWLNSTFLNNAFTAKEQEGVSTTTVRTGNNAEWVAFVKKYGLSYTSMDGGADTQDKVFLLSLEEAMEYGGYSTLADFYNNGKDKMKAIPTKYAITQGAYQSDSEKLNGTGCCWWWLRSPGAHSIYASRVHSSGSLDDFNVNRASGSVRPAFWLNLDSADIY